MPTKTCSAQATPWTSTTCSSSAWRSFEDHPAVLQALQERYRSISVDEYQDVNAAQVRLLDLLAAGGANLCVIGDPDQAIYGFRGAERGYFLAFRQQHPEAAAMRLSENYRSTQMILDAAVQVIGQSAPDEGATGERELRSVAALADFAEQVKLDVYHAPTDKAEAEYVVHQIEQMVGGTSYFSLDSGRAPGDVPTVAHSFADFAVLYRLGAQSRLLIEAFDRSGIPYQTVGQTPLHAQPQVRAILAHLWLLQNPFSRLHWTVVLSSSAPGPKSAASSVIDRVLAHLDPQQAGPSALPGEPWPRPRRKSSPLNAPASIAWQSCSPASAAASASPARSSASGSRSKPSARRRTPPSTSCSVSPALTASAWAISCKPCCCAPRPTPTIRAPIGSPS